MKTYYTTSQKEIVNGTEHPETVTVEKSGRHYQVSASLNGIGTQKPVKVYKKDLVYTLLRFGVIESQIQEKLDSNQPFA
jgi:hypothetical protein